MKIFAIYTNLVLTSKPPWLDEFRKRYNSPWDFHVTLKQPCFIEEANIDILREKVSQFFSNKTIKPLKINFEEVIIDKNQEGRVIMIAARDKKDLVDLQKKLCLKLS